MFFQVGNSGSLAPSLGRDDKTQEAAGPSTPGSPTQRTFVQDDACVSVGVLGPGRAPSKVCDRMSHQFGEVVYGSQLRQRYSTLVSRRSRCGGHEAFRPRPVVL